MGDTGWAMSRRAESVRKGSCAGWGCGEYRAPVKEFNSDVWSQRPEKNRYPAEFSGAFLDAIALGLEKAVS